MPASMKSANCAACWVVIALACALLIRLRYGVETERMTSHSAVVSDV